MSWSSTHASAEEGLPDSPSQFGLELVEVRQGLLLGAVDPVLWSRAWSGGEHGDLEHVRLLVWMWLDLLCVGLIQRVWSRDLPPGGWMERAERTPPPGTEGFSGWVRSLRRVPELGCPSTHLRSCRLCGQPAPSRSSL